MLRKLVVKIGRPLSKIDLFFALSYASVMLGFIYALEGRSDYVIFSGCVIAYIWTWNSFFFLRKEKALKTQAFSDSDRRAVYFLSYICGLASLYYVFLAGMPLLSSDPAAAKLQVSDYPVLIRFYRTIGLVPVVLAFLGKDEVILAFVRKYCLSMAAIGFLTAFKGYAFVYIAGYLICSDRLFTSKNFALLLLLIPLLIIFVAYLADIKLLDTLPYVLERLTTLQFLGTEVLRGAHGNIDYLPIFGEIELMFLKVFSDEAMSLQQNLYQIYHTFDENKLELANFYPAEIFYFYGIFGLFVFQLFLTLLIVLLRIIKKTLFVTVLLVIMHLAVIDGLVNGKLIFRLIDSGVMLLIACMLLYIYQQFHRLRFRINNRRIM